MSTGNLGGAKFRVDADTSAFEAGMKRAQATAKRTRQVVDHEAAGIGRALEKAKLDRAGRFSQGLLQVGQAVDDLQYGFRGVANNIPGIVSLFTGSAGLAGGAAIAATAVNQLVNNWDKLMDKFQAQWLNVPADHLERLRVKAEMAAEAFDKLMKSPSKLEDKQIGALQEVITASPKGGAARVFKGLAESISQDDVLKAKPTEKEAREIKDLEGLAADARKNNRPRAQAAFEKHLREIRDDISKRNQSEAARIMGEAMLPGEKGFAARAQMKGLVAKFPGAFPEQFVKGMAGLGEEGEDTDANRAAAAMLMRGPLGTQFLMRGGAAEPGGPVTKDQAMRMLRGNELLRRMNPRAKEDLARHLVGLSPEQAASVMGGMTPKDITKHAEAVTGGHIGRGAADLIGRRAEAERKAGPRAPAPDAMEGAVEGQLRAGGFEGADARGTLREMRKMQEERVKAVMMERGVNKQQATFLVAQEQAMKRFPGLNNQGQWVGGAEFRRMTSGGMTDPLPDLATKQLKELGSIKQALQKMADKTQVATAGP